MIRPARTGIRGALLGFALALAGCGSAPEGEPQTVTVPSGASFGEVLDTLSQRGVVERPTLFRIYARLKDADTQIRAGRYALRRNERWALVLDHLTEGRVVTERLTIPEGFRLTQMAPRIAELAGAPSDSVAAYLERDSVADIFGVPGPGLEGYLFPDTYRFAEGTSVERIVRTMTEHFHDYWTEERRARAEELGRSVQEITTLASIIQAEARRTEEMPTISGVYWNRLDRNHPLQADPTVLYALGGPRERLLYAAIDSVADSPYNTYSVVGLPPGPIGAPGEQALDAALHPAETDFFYFVARPDGTHVFTRTLAEHNRAKAQARRAWDQAAAAADTSTPDAL